MNELIIPEAGFAKDPPQYQIKVVGFVLRHLLAKQMFTSMTQFDELDKKIR